MNFQLKWKGLNPEPGEDPVPVTLSVCAAARSFGDSLLWRAQQRKGRETTGTRSIQVLGEALWNTEEKGS